MQRPLSTAIANGAEGGLFSIQARHMNLLRALSVERGYFLRREAIELGIDDRQLTRGVKEKLLVRIRQGAYCHRDLWEQLSPTDQHLALAHASDDLTPGDVALSHVSALADYKCPMWNVDLTFAHLTRRDSGRSRREAGVAHHRGNLPDTQVVERAGRFVTCPTRSTVDGLSLMTVESGMVSGDWMLHRGLTDFDRLWALKTEMNQWPDTRTLEITLRLLDGRSESPGESRGRYLFWWLGLPKPDLQHEVFDRSGRLVAVTDFAWPDKGIYGEFDGKVKYGRLLKPGQQAGDVVFAEKRREDEVRRATGGTMVRWIWSELHASSEPTLQLRRLLRQSA
jgi:hypothetical protein